ncbi:MAG: hypothetical protein LCH99_24245 [Proteobacteria bacterium]|nr:hypothetical protein [Pseudomonadota bacterium]
MDEDQLSLQARVIALEYLLKLTLWNVAVARADRNDHDDTSAIAEIAALADDTEEALNSATFPTAGPALSDHLAASVRDSVRRVLRELVGEMEAELGGDGQ